MDNQASTITKRAEIFGEDAKDLDLHLWDCFAATADRFPDRDALVSLWQPPWLSPGKGSAKGLRWSYRELRNEAETLAIALQGLGCRPGHYLAAVLGNSSEWGLLFWAALKIGMTFVTIDPRTVIDLKTASDKLKIKVVAVQDSQDAVSFSDIGLEISDDVILIQCSEDTIAPWRNLSGIATSLGPSTQHSGGPLQSREPIRCLSNIPLIALTSGTTGQPKLCGYTHRNLMSQTCNYDPHQDGLVDRWLVHTPVSHIFAINHTLRAWRAGGAVIFPSRTFEIDATINALVDEQCTIMSATPTLVKGLYKHPKFPGPDKIDINFVTLAGTNIGYDDIKLCREALGARNAIQAYGLTEGGPLISWARTDKLLRDGYHPEVGRVLPGAALRICHPETHEIMKLNEPGELCISGTSIISQYFCGSENDRWRQDGSRRWFATGDQGLIDDDGVVHFLGRYKDLIIRGGENIHPVKIETAILEIKDLQAHIVGIPDSLAGQVPVAVVKLPNGVDKSMVARQALSLGPSFALAGVYTFEELGLDTAPVTTLGKLKREALKKVVLEHLEGMQGEAKPHDAHEKLVNELTSIWEEVTAIRPLCDQDITCLADSITTLRFCDSVARKLGQNFYIHDILENNTVKKQALLLESRQAEAASQEFKLTSTQESQSTIRKVEPNGESKKFVKGPRNYIELQMWPVSRSQIAKASLAQHSLNPTSLEDIVPIRETLRRTVAGDRPQSYHIAMTLCAPAIPASRLHEGLRQLITVHGLLRSIFCKARDGDIFHAILAHGQRLYTRIVSEATVEYASQAASFVPDESPATNYTAHFMFKAVVLRCLEDQQTYIALRFSHSISDALTISLWLRDLDALLHDAQAVLPKVTPYKLFADMLEQYDDSLSARSAVSAYVKRLRGISLLEKAFWPPRKAPGWMVSDDSKSVLAAERQCVRKDVWNGKSDLDAISSQTPRIARVVNLPALPAVLEHVGVSAQTFTKAAVVLFNVLQTKASHAVLTTWESGRSWPFLPKWVENSLPPAMSIDGPTFEWLLNVAQVDWRETVGGFLKRIELEHTEMVEHVHAPWGKVIEELRDEGVVARDASFRQAFVWDISLGMSLYQNKMGHYKVLKPVSRQDWPDCGLFWNAFALDKNNIYFVASWDTAQMNNVEVQSHCDSLASVMRALGKEENRSKPLREVFASLTETTHARFPLSYEREVSATKGTPFDTIGKAI